MLHSGTRLEVLSVVFNISKECSAFVFGVKQSKKETLTLKIKAIETFKTPATLNSTYDITSQKIWFSIQSLLNRQLLYLRRKCHPVCMCTSIASKSVQLSLTMRTSTTIQASFLEHEIVCWTTQALSFCGLHPWKV